MSQFMIPFGTAKAMVNPTKMAKPGYLYVLSHPSDPNLYKVGQTTRHPNEQLAKQNIKGKGATGKIVELTGQKWVLKTFVAVPDVAWAKTAFWGATIYPDIPYRRGVEVEKMDWKEVEAGLDAVAKAGVRPPPKPLPDYIYANRRWMNERLKGRGIMLVGEVRSKFGKANFRCSNGHEWRTTPQEVAEGEGCPHCGLGKRSSEEIWQAIKAGTLCLLVHPEKAGVIKIGRTRKSFDQWTREKFWGEWQLHRYRNVEDLELAESAFFESVGHLLSEDGEPIEVELSKAEEAFRDLHYRLDAIIARIEKAREAEIK